MAPTRNFREPSSTWNPPLRRRHRGYPFLGRLEAYAIGGVFSGPPAPTSLNVAAGTLAAPRRFLPSARSTRTQPRRSTSDRSFMGNRPLDRRHLELPDRPRITVAIDAPDRAFAPGVQTALIRLGYNLISKRTADRQAAGQNGEAGPLVPRLLIVDDRRIPRKAGLSGNLPVILLTGAQGDVSLRAKALNGLAIGVVRRRARLTTLYELLQTAFEACPRSVPRVQDALPARATRGRESWAGAIRSISEKGCLLQSTAALENDQRVELCFPLAENGLVQVSAQTSYQAGDRTGLVFDEAIPETTRRAIADYVTARLAA